MTPKHTSCLALLLALLPLGANADAFSAALPDAGRIVLAPLNLGVRATPQLAQGIEPVWAELVRLLEERDPPPAALQRDAAAALWAEVVLSADASDAESGVYAAYARFARRVAGQVEFDALVIPALVPRRAEIQGHRASWDGVHRLVDMPRPTAMGVESGLLAVGGRGSVEAASLHVAVLSPEGELRFEGAGGVALLQVVDLIEEVDGGQLRLSDHPTPFADASSLREGVRAAFSTPLPASDAH